MLLNYLDRGFLAKRLGDQIKMVAEAETEGSLEDSDDATE